MSHVLWEEHSGRGDSPRRGSEVETVCSKEAGGAMGWAVVRREVTEMGWRGGGHFRPL